MGRIRLRFHCERDMPSSCVAANCSNKKSGDILLHRFPKDPVQFANWTKFVSEKRAKWSPNDRSVICSEHFTEDCYDLSYDFKKDFGLAPQRKRLVKNAVPTVHKQMKMKKGPLPVYPARYRKRKRTEYFEKRERKRIASGKPCDQTADKCCSSCTESHQENKCVSDAIPLAQSSNVTFENISLMCHDYCGISSSSPLTTLIKCEQAYVSGRTISTQTALIDEVEFTTIGTQTEGANTTVLDKSYKEVGVHWDRQDIAFEDVIQNGEKYIKSSVVKSFLEFCCESSFDLRDVCQNLKAAGSFLQFREILEILDTAVHKNPSENTKSSHHKIPYKENEKPVTPYQDRYLQQTEVRKEILVNANQSSLFSVSTDLTFTASQCHVSKTMNKAEPCVTNINLAQRTKTLPVFVVDVLNTKSDKIVKGRKRILLQNFDTKSLPPPPQPQPTPQPSTPPAPSPAHGPLNVTQPTGKGVRLHVLTSPTGEVSWHQIGQTQSKGLVISNVVGSQVDEWNNQQDADGVSSVDDEHGQGKCRRVSVVKENVTSDISPSETIFYKNYSSGSIQELEFDNDRLKKTMSLDADDNKERFKIKLEPMDEYDDSVESGIAEKTALDTKRARGEECQKKETIEESLGIKVEAVDDSDVGPYTVYVRSPETVGHYGEAPGDQNTRFCTRS